MKFIKTPFRFGKIQLPSNIFYAPLAGCSDYPFRKMSAHYKPGLMFCEMVKMEALIRKVPETYRMLAYHSEMRPIGGQICGSKPELAAESAKIIEDLGFDTVDFNCGCPVDKVTKDGSGSGMLKFPDKIGEVLSNMVSAVKIPVTVKIRAGWDEKSIIVKEVTQIAEAAGATAITIHGRTRQQAYKGPANWDYIKESKEAAKKILVIGNGDVNSPDAAFKMFEYTGCDGVLVARGMLGHPWIVQDILDENAGLSSKERTPEEYRDSLLKHLEYSLNFKDERGALIDMRRVCCWYLKNVVGAREFRAKASHATSLAEVRELIHNFELKKVTTENEVNHEEDVELLANVKGDVRGVGFRSTVFRHAQKIGLVGCVRNLSNSSVEIVAQGSKEELENFLKNVQSNPGHAKIVSITSEYRVPSTRFNQFNII